MTVEVLWPEHNYKVVAETMHNGLGKESLMCQCKHATRWLPRHDAIEEFKKHVLLRCPYGPGPLKQEVV